MALLALTLLTILQQEQSSFDEPPDLNAENALNKKQMDQLFETFDGRIKLRYFPRPGKGGETTPDDVAKSLKALSDVLEKTKRVTNLRIDEATQTATFNWRGWWKDVPDLEATVRAKVPVYFVAPVPMKGKLKKLEGSDPQGLETAMRAVNGINHAHVEAGSAEIQFDLQLVDVGTIYQQLDDGKVQFTATTHAMVSLTLEGAGDFAAVEKALGATPGVLWLRADPTTNSVKFFMGGKANKEQLTKTAQAAGWTGVKDLVMR